MWAVNIMRMVVFKAMAGLIILWLPWGATGGMNADITVTGDISASTCEIIAPNNGTYNFGKISATSGKSEVLMPITQTWRVRCTGDTLLSIEPQDNRVGTASRNGAAYFGLGGDDAQPLGYYRLKLSQAKIGNQEAVAYTSGQAFSRNGDTYLMSGVRTQWLMPDRTTRMDKIYSIDITVSPWLEQDKLPLAEGGVLNGSVTLNFFYGL